MRYYMHFLKAIVAVSILCIATDRAHSQGAENWSECESVFGAQMSIALSNNIVAAGFTVILECRCRNTTTNAILARVDPTYDFQVLLVKSSGASAGRTYELTQNRETRDSSVRATRWLTGTTSHCSIPVTIAKSIGPGEYKLR